MRGKFKMKYYHTTGVQFGETIKNVEVPEQLRKKFESGISWFDGAYGGQLTPSNVTLFTGAPGAGKTTATLQIANGLTKRGHLVVFNTCEESLYQTKIVFDRLGLDAGFRIGEEKHVPTLVAKLEALRKRVNPEHMVLIVDSLQELDDGKYKDGHTNSRTAERCLALLSLWAKETYSNVIAIGQVTKGGSAAGSNKLRHMVDTLLELDIEDKDEEYLGMRLFSTEKNRHGGAGHLQVLEMKPYGFKFVCKHTIS